MVENCKLESSNHDELSKKVTNGNQSLADCETFISDQENEPKTSSLENQMPSCHKMKQMSKSRILKNLLVTGFGFLLLFLAFQGLANLQSTMNSVNSLGVHSQIVIYIGLALSSMFLPTILIKRLGCKLTIALSILTYSPYIAANFYPHLGTFMPTAFLLGVGGAPLWSSASTYVNQIGFLFNSYGNASLDSTMALFFGLFFLFFQSSQVWGNLISYFVLKPYNETEFIVSNESLATCGAYFCNEESNITNPNLQPPTDEKRYMLIGIYLSCSVLAAVIVLIFLDPLDAEKEDKAKKESVISLIFSTFKICRKLDQLLLIPVIVYNGIQQVFILSDFTKAYVACAWGIHRVGFVFICFGVTNVLISLFSGPLVKYLTRVPVVLFGAAGQFATIIGLFLWRPTPDQPAMFFLLIGIWGMSDAVWHTQLHALCGILFKSDQEAAFANFQLWTSIGFFISFAYANHLCISTIMYILLGMLAAGLTGYLIVEARVYRKKDQYNIKMTLPQENKHIYLYYSRNSTNQK